MGAHEDAKGFNRYASELKLPTKSDTPIDFAALGANVEGRVPRGILIGGSGALKITTWEGTDITFADGEIATGIIHPISVQTIWNTGSGSQNVWILF